jgi:hypothetical protein
MAVNLRMFIQDSSSRVMSSSHPSAFAYSAVDEPKGDPHYWPEQINSPNTDTSARTRTDT